MLALMNIIYAMVIVASASASSFRTLQQPAVNSHQAPNITLGECINYAIMAGSKVGKIFLLRIYMVLLYYKNLMRRVLTYTYHTYLIMYIFTSCNFHYLMSIECFLFITLLSSVLYIRILHS